MKKLFILFILLTGIVLNGYGQEKGYPNPAVMYIQKMGYAYEMRTDANGNQHAVCIFPDGTVADAWAFLTGQAGKEFSYCAKQGYSTESMILDHGTWRERAAVCTKAAKNGMKESIPMTELMEKNGEPLIESGEMAKPESDEGEQNDVPESRIKDAPASSLPGSFDWRSTPAGYPYPGDPAGLSYIGAVRDQLTCTACYAFGACANAEGVYDVSHHVYNVPGYTTDNCIDLSESYIMWCLGTLPQYHKHFYGCKGADYSYSELEAQITNGVELESDFPYTPKNGKCMDWADSSFYYSAWYRVSCADTEGIKQAIYQNGVIDAAVNSTTAFFNYYDGIYSDKNTTCFAKKCEDTPINHAVSLVGWGGASGARYFILRNSWGSTWGGLGGYMLIDMFSARVACEAAYLVASPTTLTLKQGTKGGGNAGNPGSKILIYPNPSNGEFNLEYKGTAPGKVLVTVYSLSGQEVLNREFQCIEGLNTYSIDLGRLSHGMYFLELRDQEGKAFEKISLE